MNLYPIPYNNINPTEVYAKMALILNILREHRLDILLEF